MAAIARELRPLPGVRFQAVAPPRSDVLPRMDVAAFAGFAASGPLHVPVAVEDVSHFEAIFGTDAPIAWDPASGVTLYAYLAPSVRAFFKNGGLRAWIVRVADPTTATANVFPIPGLVELTESARMIPASAVARAPGSWSDPLLVKAALFAHPLRYVSSDFSKAAGPVVVAQLVSPSDVVVGDMLRVTFRLGAGTSGAGRIVLMAPVASITAAVLPSGLASQFVGASPLWFQTTAPASVSAWSGTTTVGGVAVTVTSITSGLTDGAYTLSLATSTGPAPGSVLGVAVGGAATLTFWFTVATVTPMANASQVSVSVTGTGLWAIPPPAASLLGDPNPLLERLTFQLGVTDPDGSAFELTDLGFASAHPRAFWALPSDAELYGAPLSPIVLGPHEIARRDSLADASPKSVELISEASTPRFPLASRSSAGAILYPVGMPVADSPPIGCGADPATALHRDGLDLTGTTLSGLFVDPILAGALTTDLLDMANAVRYAGPAPRALLGIHAVLDLEEAALIAAPDAVHAGWSKNAAPPAGTVQPPPVQTPPAGLFAGCAPPLPAPQGLACTAGPDETGTYTLSWDGVAVSGTAATQALTYVVKESPSSNFADPNASEVAVVSTPTWTAYARAPNVYFYWVAAQLGSAIGPYSAGLSIRVEAARYWIAADNPPSPAADLLDVQRALLRVCSVRGDLFAVLGLPDGYREQDAVNHAAALRTPAVQSTSGVPPLGFGEQAALAFGALYHPWPMGRDEGAVEEVRKSPPDGAMTGVIARRALDRGAWISPANVVLSGVVALNEPVARSALSILQDAQVNAIRNDARGFLCMADDTLSNGPGTVPTPINVRRLLSLLRRSAQDTGADYVFEPNDGRLSRRVQRGFGGLLAALFARGAFAGATPDQSYQLKVVTDSGSAADVAQGFFIVDILVAPSYPLHFLTVRLVQTGDSGTITEPS